MGELAQLITSIATLIAAVGALGLGWHNAGKIEQVHKATNSMKDELVAVTRSDARQEGVTEGRKLEKDGTN